LTGFASAIKAHQRGKTLPGFADKVCVLSILNEMAPGWFFNRNKARLDIYWLRDEILEESN